MSQYILYFLVWIYAPCKNLLLSYSALQELALYRKPASVAQLDARPTGDQVTGSTSAGLATFITKTCPFKYTENFTTKKLKNFR